MQKQITGTPPCPQEEPDVYRRTIEIIISATTLQHTGQAPPLHTGKPTIAMKNGPFEDVFPIKHGDLPLLC